jgi:DnaJ-class molecular chaperone
MPDPYDVLGVTPDADDDLIRKKYLELVRRYPPDTHGDKFNEVRAAYDALRDQRTRVAGRLFDLGKSESIETIIEEVACRSARRRMTLETLLTLLNRR